MVGIESNLIHGHLPSKSQISHSWNVATGMKQSEVGLFSQSMSLYSGDTLGAYVGTRGAGSLLYVRSNSKKTRASSVLAAMDSFGSLSFARGKGAYHSRDHVVESLNNFPMTSTYFLLLYNVAFQHSTCVRALSMLSE